MIERAEPHRGRLRALEKRGDPRIEALWIDALSSDEALQALAEREEPVFRLQKARSLLDLQRKDEAKEALRGLEGLPPGLEVVRRELLARLAPAPAATELPREAFSGRVATKTLAELYAAQGDVEMAVSTYREVLAREPSDDEARSRLRELLGEGRPGPEADLAGWLQSVRLWRKSLGV